MIIKPKNRLVLPILIIVVVFLAVWFFYQKQLESVSKTNGNYRSFTITKGQSLQQISRNLAEQKLIKNAQFFRVYVQLSGLATKLQAGSYQLSAGDSAKVIAQKLTQGFTDVWVTIPEGWRIEEVADKLVQDLSINRQDFLNQAQEGYMFPDTYRFSKGATGIEIAKTMRTNFDRKFDKTLKDQLAKSGLSLNELIILASIVEREVRFDADRPIVAGILLSRLIQGLPLEVDATIQYAIGFDKEQKTYWKNNLTEDDLKINSPYNTRRVSGIPPGPICSPGLAAIKAVANPQKTDYLYYLSDSAGKIYYSKTFEQHITNINKHL